MYYYVHEIIAWTVCSGYATFHVKLLQIDTSVGKSPYCFRIILELLLEREKWETRLPNGQCLGQPIEQSGVIALNSWPRQFTLTVPLPTHEYKWILAICWDVACDGLVSHLGVLVQFITNGNDNNISNSVGRQSYIFSVIVGTQVIMSMSDTAFLHLRVFPLKPSHFEKH